MDVAANDYCRWHIVNAILDNVKSNGYYGLYCEDDLFRKYIRYFNCLTTIHLDCAELGASLILKNSWKEIKGKGRNVYRSFWNEHLDKQWLKKLGLVKLNSQGSYVLDNNYSEGWNRKTLMDLGRGNNFWTFIWNMKRFLAVIALKYERFELKGFERKRSNDRIERLTSLQLIWDTFEAMDRTKEEVVWKYLNCLYLCWDNEYDELRVLLNSL